MEALVIVGLIVLIAIVEKNRQPVVSPGVIASPQQVATSPASPQPTIVIVPSAAPLPQADIPQPIAILQQPTQANPAAPAAQSNNVIAPAPATDVQQPAFTGVGGSVGPIQTYFPVAAPAEPLVPIQQPVQSTSPVFRVPLSRLQVQ